MAVRCSAQVMENPVDILLVDNRRLVRAGIERVLEDSGYLMIAGEASCCDDAIRLIRSRQPRIVLVNLQASAVDVLDGVRKMRRQMPSVRVLVLTDESDLIVLERLLQTGVSGCISSSCSIDELLEALQTILAGDRYLSDALARKLAERRTPDGASSAVDRLTHRELQILLLLAKGKKTSIIARDLCLTRKTVNGYRSRLLEKLHAGTDVELMYMAARHGLINIAGVG